MFESLRERVECLSESFSNEREKEIFIKCFFNTLDTTCQFQDDGSVFIITGDIPAMWLRDSAAQVMQYLPFTDDDEVGALIKGVIRRQLQMILIDPYANAFMKDESCVSEWEGLVQSDRMPKIVWERKFELDSLCYPLLLLSKYYDATSDDDVLDELFLQAFDVILDIFERERAHSKLSTYYFHRDLEWSLESVGEKVPEGECGLIWTGFRPSDDPCKYPYHIPDNMFAVSVLCKMQTIFAEHMKDEARAQRCESLALELKGLIEQYGIVETNQGKGYVSECDCLGNYALYDDANIPSLLSIPYLEYPYLDEEIYANTRARVLSKDNVYYYEGNVAKGIGSPHTPKDRVWPLAVAMQGITSTDPLEIRECYEALLNLDNGSGYMHESVDVNDPNIYTRDWFAWANSLYAYFVLKHKDILIK